LTGTVVIIIIKNNNQHQDDNLAHHRLSVVISYRLRPMVFYNLKT